MRKWLVLGAVALALSAAGTLLALLLPPPACPVNRASVESLRAGMTADEVAAVLGGPPGDYRVGPRLVTVGIHLAPSPGHTAQQWRGDDGLAVVEFGPDGRLARADFFDMPPVPLSLWQRLRLLIGL